MAVAGCQSGVLLVDITAAPPIDHIDRMTVHVSVGGQTRSADVPAGAGVGLDATPRTVGIKIPESLRKGSIKVHVEAVRGAEILDGHGEHPDVAAALAAGTHVAVRVGGGGGGGDGGVSDGGVSDGGVLDGGLPDAGPPDLTVPRDGSGECANAIACQDFEGTDASQGTTMQPAMNAVATVEDIGGGQGHVMHIVPGNRGPLQAGLAVPLITYAGMNTPLYIRLRMRFETDPMTSLDFAAINLRTVVPTTRLYLGASGVGAPLVGWRYDGLDRSDWPVAQADRVRLGSTWHCVLWQVVFGNGMQAQAANLWLDGNAVPGWDFPSLMPVPWGPLAIGLDAMNVAAVPSHVWIDDVLVTLRPPSRFCP